MSVRMKNNNIDTSRFFNASVYGSYKVLKKVSNVYYE